MPHDHYAIPAEFADQLTLSHPEHTRSNKEILAALSKHVPITSEKNIWAYWHSGLDKMPAWCRRNIVSWHRICGPSWTVRLLDSVPGSPNHALNFVPAEMLPEAFVKNAMDGEYFGPHSADLLRGACLYLHGGAFMDVGNLLVRSLDRVCWDALADPASPFRVAAPWMYGITIANHFVAARKGDPWIKRWHELFVHLWRGKTNSAGLAADPLVAFARSLSFDDGRASNFHWDFKVEAHVVMEYITQVVCWMRLCMVDKDEGDGFVGAEYWRHHVLIWDVLKESWGGEQTVGFVGAGQKMFDLFAVRLDADPGSEEYQAAYRLTWRLLTRSTMQKVTHGKHLTNDEHLGVLWDRHDGKDCEEGTFGALLRYGCEHFRQTRESIEYRDAPAPPTTLDKGVFEP